MSDRIRRFCRQCMQESDSDADTCPVCAGPLLRLQSPNLVGEILDGRYEIVDIIAKGGMGVVYRARQKFLDRDVAVKVLRTDILDDPAALKRFLIEAKAASALSSPHTVTIHDFGVTPDGLLFLVMELLKGTSLAEVLKSEGRLPFRRAVDIVLQACNSLSEAHQKTIWHRDIKPDNIYLVRGDRGDEFVKIVDFGIAKSGAVKETITSTGVICGTPEYLSPEQARGGSVDHRCDIYSLGIVLYEMLTGAPPFHGETAVKILLRHAMDRPPPMKARCPGADIPEALDKVVTRALEKKPKNRFSSIGEFEAALRSAAGVQQQASLRRKPGLAGKDEKPTAGPGEVTTEMTDDSSFEFRDPEATADETQPAPAAPRKWKIVAGAGAAALALLTGLLWFGLPALHVSPIPDSPPRAESRGEQGALHPSPDRPSPDRQEGATLVTQSPNSPDPDPAVQPEELVEPYGILEPSRPVEPQEIVEPEKSVPTEDTGTRLEQQGDHRTGRPSTESSAIDLRPETVATPTSVETDNKPEPAGSHSVGGTAGAGTSALHKKTTKLEKKKKSGDVKDVGSGQKDGSEARAEAGRKEGEGTATGKEPAKAPGDEYETVGPDDGGKTSGKKKPGEDDEYTTVPDKK